MDSWSIMIVVFVVIGTGAIIAYTFVSLRGSRKRFEDFQRKFEGDNWMREATRRGDIVVEYKHDSEPVMSSSVTRDMECDEPEEKGPRPLRSIDLE